MECRSSCNLKCGRVQSSRPSKEEKDGCQGEDELTCFSCTVLSCAPGAEYDEHLMKRSTDEVVDCTDEEVSRSNE
jgi:hypothetical protein